MIKKNFSQVLIIKHQIQFINYINKKNYKNTETT
jgi:hypothetical protein